MRRLGLYIGLDRPSKTGTPRAVAITAPSPGVATALGAVTVSGTFAGTGAGAVTQVAVYFGARLLGTATLGSGTWSYSWVPWSNDLGAKALTAVASGASGAPITSAGVNMTVTAPSYLWGWYDPSVSTYVTLSGGNVTALADITGNSRPIASAGGGLFAQGTGANQVNALNTLVGAKVASQYFGPAGTGPQEGYAVAKFAGGLPFPSYCGLMTQSGLLWVEGNSGSSALFSGFGTTYVDNAATSAVTAGAHVFGWSYGSNVSTTEFTIGNQRNFLTGGDWIGPIGEIVLANRVLNSGERGAVNSYLKSKWGTP